MNKTKIVIGINIVFIALIIVAFLPALKSGNEGYNTKTVTVKPAQQEEPAKTEIEAPVATTTAADEAVVEEQIASVTTPRDTNEEEIATNDVAPATEATTPEAETITSSEPVESATETIAPTAESTTPAVETATNDEPAEPATQVQTTAESAVGVDGLYSVVDGNKLDAHSYGGFKQYRNWCARCHGTYGQGMIGPDLAESLKVISKEEFYDTVENGKSGTIGSMPAWKTNPQVMENRDQLYAYLKARSDGAIGVVKPVQQK